MADKNDKIRQSRVFNTTFDDLFNQMTGENPLADPSLGEIVISDEGEMTIGGYTLTATGLVVSDGATFEDWEKTGVLLFRLEGAIQLLIGDWLVQAEWVWGRTYDQIAEKTGRDPKTLRNYKYVAQSVDLSLRRDNLTYTHYFVVAALPDARKAQLLEQAANEGWSVRQLRQAAYPPALMQNATGERTEIFQAFDEKSKGISKLKKTMRRAGQGDESARMEALGRIAKYRAWLDELEEWLSDE